MRSRSEQQALESLESRALLAVNPGLIQGVAFIDADGDQARDAGEVIVQGISVTLTRVTPAAPPLTLETTTDADGAYAFRTLEPGTYRITAEPGEVLQGDAVEIDDIVVVEGDAEVANVPLEGIAPAFLSLRQFLTTATFADFPFEDAGADANQAPTVRAAAETVLEAQENDAPTTIDLNDVFLDIDSTSRVLLETNQGDINVVLFDGATPLTVANFYNYIESDRFDNTIFHRLAITPATGTTPAIPFVLQGGGYRFDADASEVIEVDADDPVQNEFSATRSNLIGTLAMAKSPGNPNSATNEFFFNLGNNSANLDNQNGGFTVFGRILSDADQAILDAIEVIPIENHGSPVNEIPLVTYEGTTFRTDITTNPVRFETDAVADDFVLLENVEVVTEAESLTYSVISNSNPDLVTAEIVDNELVLTYGEDEFGTANVVVRATDNFGASVETTFEITVFENTLPEATVTLAPTTPTVTSTLTATATGDDADGDDVTFTYQWFVNNVLKKTTSDTASTSDTLNPTSLIDNYTPAKGDIIRVEVTPNDGPGNFDDGETESAEVTIANSVPSIGTVSLDPLAPADDGMVTATVASQSDADAGDTVMLTYVWQIGSTTVRTATKVELTDTLDLADPDVLLLATPMAGNAIKVTVTPNDGTANGASQMASTVVNSAPSITSLMLSSTSPFTNDMLTATVETADVNGDTVTLTYAWFVNNVAIVGATTDTLDLSQAGNGNRGDEVRVQVTPNDSKADGQAEEATATVANSLPTVEVTIENMTNPGNAPTTTDTLMAATTTDDADGDAVTLTYVWKINDVEVPGVTGDTFDLSTVSVTANDVISVQVTPNDGLEDGLADEASVVLV